MLVLFTSDAETAEHDLGRAFHRLLDRDLPIGSPVWESLEIQDRAGNAACSVALAPVRL